MAYSSNEHTNRLRQMMVQDSSIKRRIELELERDKMNEIK